MKWGVANDFRTLNIKLFKIPNDLNKFAYKFFRKSKAKTPCDYADYVFSSILVF